MKKVNIILTILFLATVIWCSTPTAQKEIWTLPAQQAQQPNWSREWPRPQTSEAPANTNIAHQQLNQNSPPQIQEQLRTFMQSLPWVTTKPSRISVSWARALYIEDMTWPFITWNERAHLHPEYDGSLHVALDSETMQELVDTWRWEYHPRNPTTIMLYGPRNQEELVYIQSVLQQWLGKFSKSETEIETSIEDVLPEVVVTPPPPYSTQALIEETFEWSDLRLEAVENTTATYTRYRISYLSNWLRISWIMNIPSWEWPYPLVILNHGYIDPAVYTVWRGLKREQDYLARNGYAVLHTDYRNHGLSDKDPTLDQNYLFRNYFYTQDSLNAIVAVQSSLLPELQSIDSDRVGMMGHSMGWWVTMHGLIARPDLIDAAVLYAPVHASERYNFDRRRSDDLNTSQRQERQERIGELTIENFMPYSATPYVDTITAPVQIYFGTNDLSVPYQRGVDIQNIFTQAWVTSELITYQWEKHEFIPKWESFMQWVVDFFDGTI